MPLRSSIAQERRATALSHLANPFVDASFGGPGRCRSVNRVSPLDQQANGLQTFTHPRAAFGGEGGVDFDPGDGEGFDIHR